LSTKPGSTNQMRRHSKRRDGIKSNENKRVVMTIREGKISARVRLAAQNLWGVETPIGNIHSRSITRQLRAQRNKVK